MELDVSRSKAIWFMSFLGSKRAVSSVFSSFSSRGCEEETEEGVFLEATDFKIEIRSISVASRGRGYIQMQSAFCGLFGAFVEVGEGFLWE